ncbi:MAG TPA: prolyl oligopeptidase family serine peptidase [Mycobacteriales bacterium]|nr:prolyl oligopeptidase family serine peptidase [Mycobacteriales bacterium]
MTDYGDIAAFVGLPRLTGLTLSPDGVRLVGTVQQPDAKDARYVSALWEIPLGDGDPARLTRSEKGESAPAFRPDGSLVFTSARPVPDGEADEAALWVLPPAGEPRVLARAAGGLSGPVVAAEAGTVLVTGSRLVGSGPDDDAERRKTRQDRRISGILHTGMPIRFWDHELGAESPRLLVADAGGELRDLAPDAAFGLVNADWSVTADAVTVATTWHTRGPRGAFRSSVVLIDVATGERSTLAEDADREHDGPRIAPDGSLVAMNTRTDGSYETPSVWGLRIVPAKGGSAVPVELGDLDPAEYVWAPDSRILYVAGDLHGSGAVVAVDPATGSVLRRLAGDGVFSSLCPSPDGRYVYALRSAIDAAPAPVRLDTAAADQTPVDLPTPAPMPALPGRVEAVRAAVGGATVRGWLATPADADGPTPLMVWIHGGPFSSWNSWSWRWNAWVAVAQGWSVLMPDPALSTGYGPDWIARAWPHRAAPVWADLEGLLDAVVARPDIDETRTACLGASFGGYMTNWIAGHTDRFGAIVTHSGTWALDQKNDTADVAQHWDTMFGRPEAHPDWYAENSPHRNADRIRTPLLVIHGNRDYRVPVSEALRLWWDLVGRWEGDPAELPHRFLNFPTENHWILSPANAEIWYDAILGFCAEHVLGRPWRPSALL